MDELTIWKFPFEIKDEFEIEIPEEFTVLSVQVQDGQPCIWAVVNPTSPKMRQGFILRGTGHPFSGNLKYAEGNPIRSYIATFQTAEGRLVWHLFFKKAKHRNVN